MSRTLIIVKPDAVSRQFTGSILQMFEDIGVKVVGLKMLHLTKERAEAFYAVHKERPFFNSLVEFMTSGPCVPTVLETDADNIIEIVRDKMGSTNSNEAALGTIRQKFGTDIEKNAVHGSDSPENAAIEIAFFFEDGEIVSR